MTVLPLARAFSEAETADLAERYVVALGPSSVRVLHAHCGGNAAALRLTLLLLQEVDDADAAVLRAAARSTGRPVRVVPLQRGPGDQLVEQLTPRELEVLVHLSELLSTEEIAAAMYVSVNTIRTHVRSILRKLAVSRRNEAVRRGRALGLV
jgi:DNA-binding CsgD family transcriptional regulator